MELVGSICGPRLDQYPALTDTVTESAVDKERMTKPEMSEFCAREAGTKIKNKHWTKDGKTPLTGRVSVERKKCRFHDIR